MRILALDTATECCSAALLLEDTVSSREIEVARGHAELILTMVDELLSESSATLTSLDAVAFGRGPGSFTGVRLAASVAQGLAFGAGLPVIPVSDLRAVAQRAVPHLPNTPARHTIVCNDARMNEVYWGCFAIGADSLMLPVGLERVSKPNEVRLPEGWLGSSVSGVGRGFAAYKELLAPLRQQLGYVDDTILPCARAVAELAVTDVRAGRLLPPEGAVPVYLRDDVARPKPP